MKQQENESGTKEILKVSKGMVGIASKYETEQWKNKSLR